MNKVFIIISNAPLMEKVESCRFLWPSRRGPFPEGVKTADSGKVGVHEIEDTFDLGES